MSNNLKKKMKSRHKNCKSAASKLETLRIDLLPTAISISSFLLIFSQDEITSAGMEISEVQRTTNKWVPRRLAAKCKGCFSGAGGTMTIDIYVTGTATIPSEPSPALLEMMSLCSLDETKKSSLSALVLTV